MPIELRQIQTDLESNHAFCNIDSLILQSCWYHLWIASGSIAIEWCDGNHHIMDWVIAYDYAIIETMTMIYGRNHHVLGLYQSLGHHRPTVTWFWVSFLWYHDFIRLNDIMHYFIGYQGAGAPWTELTFNLVRLLGNISDQEVQGSQGQQQQLCALNWINLQADSAPANITLSLGLGLLSSTHQRHHLAVSLEIWDTTMWLLSDSIREQLASVLPINLSVHTTLQSRKSIYFSLSLSLSLSLSVW